MYTMKETTLHNEKGFALLAAIIASLILLAVGMLVINMSAGDLISSSVSVGTKMAITATESGVFRLVETFTPANLNGYYACTGSDTAASLNSVIPSPWQTASSTDPKTQYVICNAQPSPAPPICMPQYSCPQWGGVRYFTTVIGQNSSYNSFAKIDVGIAFGPVPTQ